MANNVPTSDLRVAVGTTVKFNGKNYGLRAQAFNTFLGSQGRENHLTDAEPNSKDPKYIA
ncbi:hypothetical protein SESBI_33977 [Sesbania bispinosa]|nr:hypothetical protein SESBI_33977 [Sesbania bispinosa]